MLFIAAPDEGWSFPKLTPKTTISIVRYGPPAIRPQVWRPTFLATGAWMPFENLSDHFIIHMYESIRDQVLADTTSGVRLAGTPARVRAEELRQEIERRGLFCRPIEWSVDV
jgi:hypothetical protein